MTANKFALTDWNGVGKSRLALIKDSKKIKMRTLATEQERIRTRVVQRRIDSNLTSNHSSSSSKCIPVTDANLHSISGKLNLRLNTSVQHLPEKTKAKKAKCALHRWARGIEENVVVTSGVIT